MDEMFQAYRDYRAGRTRCLIVPPNKLGRLLHRWFGVGFCHGELWHCRLCGRVMR